MAYKLIRKDHSESLKAASNIAAGFTPVRLSASNGNEVVPLGTNGVKPFGMVESIATYGENVAVQVDSNLVKARAAASLGPNVEVGIASDNGALSAAAAASGRFAVGVSRTPADAGEIFTVEIRPRQVY